MDISSLQIKPKTLEGLVRLAEVRGIAVEALIEETLNSLFGGAGKAMILDLSGLTPGQKIEIAVRRPRVNIMERILWAHVDSQVGQTEPSSKGAGQ